MLIKKVRILILIIVRYYQLLRTLYSGVIIVILYLQIIM